MKHARRPQRQNRRPGPVAAGPLIGEMMVLPLTDSPNLFPVPPIDPSNFVELRDDSYGDWATALREHEGAVDFLLRPGDYRPWGTLLLRGAVGNSAQRPSTLRYYNPGVDDEVHPVRRSRAALVDSFHFAGPGTRDWLVHGLTVSHPTGYPIIDLGASNITIDFCLVEYGMVHSFRIRHGIDCTIQRCVIRETIRPENVQDSVGIEVGNIDADVTGIKILDNEIYNVGDGIQLADGPAPRRPVEVLMEGNDIYLEPSRYIGDTNTTWDENAIDMKAGSDVPESTIIRNNRMWGFRRNARPSAFGELIVVQKYCRNAVIEDNIMGDAPRGMKDEGWKSGAGVDPNVPRNVVFRNNQFYDIRDYSTLDAGAVTKPITSAISFIANYFARSDYLADATPPAYRGGGPIYTGNILVDVGSVQRPEGHPSLVLQPGDDNRIATAPHGYDTYERRRWTGPEVAIGAIPVVVSS